MVVVPNLKNLLAVTSMNLGGYIRYHCKEAKRETAQLACGIAFVASLSYTG
jgi:hypothetical protein